MKVTQEKVTYEGPVEELIKAGVIKALTLTPGTISSSDAKETHLPNGLPQHIRDLLQKHSPGGPAGEAFRSFLKEVLSWEGVEARRGPSKNSDDGMADYVHLHRHGSQWGGFAYVLPRSRVLVFRLPKTAVTGLKHASLRNVKASDHYKVRLRLESADTLSEAINLAKQAYEDALSTK